MRSGENSRERSESPRSKSPEPKLSFFAELFEIAPRNSGVQPENFLFGFHLGQIGK